MKNTDEEKFLFNGKELHCNQSGELDLRKITDEDIKRNPDWPFLNWNIIDAEVGGHSKYEYIMCETQCKTDSHAIKSIKNYRKINSDINVTIFSLELEEEKNRRRNRYLRTHYNDLEDDNYERHEIRCLNG